MLAFSLILSLICLGVLIGSLRDDNFVMLGSNLAMLVTSAGMLVNNSHQLRDPIYHSRNVSQYYKDVR